MKEGNYEGNGMSMKKSYCCGHIDTTILFKAFHAKAFQAVTPVRSPSPPALVYFNVTCNMKMLPTIPTTMKSPPTNAAAK